MDITIEGGEHSNPSSPVSGKSTRRGIEDLAFLDERVDGLRSGLDPEIVREDLLLDQIIEQSEAGAKSYPKAKPSALLFTPAPKQGQGLSKLTKNWPGNDFTNDRVAPKGNLWRDSPDSIPISLRKGQGIPGFDEEGFEPDWAEGNPAVGHRQTWPGFIPARKLSEIKGPPTPPPGHKLRGHPGFMQRGQWPGMEKGSPPGFMQGGQSPGMGRGPPPGFMQGGQSPGMGRGPPPGFMQGGQSPGIEGGHQPGFLKGRPSPEMEAYYSDRRSLNNITIEEGDPKPSAPVSGKSTRRNEYFESNRDPAGKLNYTEIVQNELLMKELMKTEYAEEGGFLRGGQPPGMGGGTPPRFMQGGKPPGMGGGPPPGFMQGGQPPGMGGGPPPGFMQGGQPPGMGGRPPPGFMQGGQSPGMAGRPPPGFMQGGQPPGMGGRPPPGFMQGGQPPRMGGGPLPGFMQGGHSSGMGGGPPSGFMQGGHPSGMGGGSPPGFLQGGQPPGMGGGPPPGFMQGGQPPGMGRGPSLRYSQYGEENREMRGDRPSGLAGYMQEMNPLGMGGGQPSGLMQGGQPSGMGGGPSPDYLQGGQFPGMEGGSPSEYMQGGQHPGMEGGRSSGFIQGGPPPGMNRGVPLEFQGKPKGPEAISGFPSGPPQGRPPGSPDYGGPGPGGLENPPPEGSQSPAGFALMQMAQKKIQFQDRLQKIKGEPQGPAPPHIPTVRERLKALRQQDDFGGPVRWVTLNSPDTKDGLARMTDTKTHKNQQFVIEGELYVPIVDDSMARLGWTTEANNAALIEVTTRSNVNEYSLKVIMRSMNLNYTTEKDWLAYETVVGSKYDYGPQCAADACQSRCYKSGCDAACKGDTCHSGCVGVGCNAIGRGPGSNAMCIGDQCTAKCEGLSCEAKCFGKDCSATCTLLSCVYTVNGHSGTGTATWDDLYPQYGNKDGNHHQQQNHQNDPDRVPGGRQGDYDPGHEDYNYD